MKQLKFLGVLLIMYPFAAWAISNPIKILFPQLAGVVCVESWLCVDDLAHLDEARTLYLKALANVESRLSPLTKKPLVVFCSSQPCFSSFGFDNEAAQSIGGFGVVIAPRGWQSYFVEHELIHQWQTQTFGTLQTWMAPRWITEGMAYALSNDPRPQLVEPYQSYRQQFQQRFGETPGDGLALSLAADM